MSAHPDDSMVHYVLMTVLYGAIQAILAVPVLYGFAALVFSSHVYREYMASIAKVFMLSSFFHASAIASLSSLPYAIGQVQDAGLLFYCKIATDIAKRMKDEAPAAVVATAIVTMAIATTIVGLSLIVVGRVKLANLVFYIPMPVFGGYLAFIGFFCVEAGLSLTSGKGINGVETWYLLFESDRELVLVILAVLTGAILCWVARNMNTLALPLVTCAIPIVFYSILWCSGSSIDEAREYGWLGPPNSVSSWEAVLSMYDVSLVHWSVLPYQIPPVLAMILVIIFGSTMDIAAIEMGTGQPLDVDDQLVTIGMSNTIAGLGGGFAGSYIFTQTLLGFKFKFEHRSVAFTLAGIQLIVFLLSIDPLACIPLFFFASTIIFIGIDLLLEWIIEVRSKLAVGEYVVLLVTFGSIVAYGMDSGFLIGVIAAVLNFAYEYVVATRESTNRYVVNISTRMRSSHLRKPDHERKLKQHSGAIRTLELHGSIFFGSAAGVLRDIIDACNVSSKAHFGGSSYGSFSGSSRASFFRPGSHETVPLMGSRRNSNDVSVGGDNMSIDMASDSSHGKEMYLKFLVLDCRNLKGVDATAAKRCFCQLLRFAERRQINIVYAGCPENVFRILDSHGSLVLPWSRSFDNIYDALNWCETTLLAELTIFSGNGTAENRDFPSFEPLNKRMMSFRSCKRLSVEEVLQLFFELSDQQTKELEQYASFYQEKAVDAEEMLFYMMDDPDCFYILLEGELQTFIVESNTASGRGTKLHPGACFGHSDYILNQPRTFFAKATCPSVVACFSRDKMETLMKEKSVLSIYLLQSALELQSLFI